MDKKLEQSQADGGTSSQRGRTAFPTRTVAAGLSLVAVSGLLALRPRKADEGIGYPPLDRPKPLADAIWTVDSGPISAMGLKMPVRMTVIRLKSGDVLLHSPTRHTADLARRLEEIGPLRHFVAPATGHWTFLQEWQQAYPEAKTWAVPVLRDRPQVRRSGVRIDEVLGEGAPDEWGAGLRLGMVRGGGGFEEAWLYHEDSRTLILTDMIENLDPKKLPALTALLMRATFATKATTALHVRAALKAGGDGARRAIGELVALEPESLVFAHGDLIRGGGAARLRQAFAWFT